MRRVRTLKLNFLVYGSGAREHAIAKKLAESNFCNKLFLYGANDGFSHIGAALDGENLIESAKKNKVDVLVVGPENPLCDGITDEFLKAGIKCIGVNKYWSQLESSKYFAKLFRATRPSNTRVRRAFSLFCAFPCGWLSLPPRF